MPVEFAVLQSFFGGEIFSNVNVFVLLMIFLGGLIGIVSTRLSIGAFGAFLIFIDVGVTTDLWIFNSLLYVVLVSMFVVMGFRIYGYATNNSMEEA